MDTIGRAFDTTKNLWYQDVPGKGRVYDSPAAYGQAPPQIGGGLVHKDPQWDQSGGAWDAGIDWGKIYTLGTGAALGAGALSAAGAFGAAGSGAGGASGAGAGGGTAAAGGGVGWLDTAKKVYDGYKTGRSALGDLAGDVGAMAGGAAYSRAQGRVDEAGIQQRQDALEIARRRYALESANTDVLQRKFALEAPGTRAGNAVRGDVLAHAQDATVAPGSLGPNVQVPTISGGLRPSMFSDSTRQLGGLMSDQALQGQQAGDHFDPLPAMPDLTPLPQSTGLDTFLNTAGSVGTGMDAFLQWLQRYKASQPHTTSTPQVQGPSGLLDPMSEGNYA